MVPGLIPDYEPPDRERIMLSCQISVAKIRINDREENGTIPAPRALPTDGSP